jgi:hypothetical protein
MDRLFVGRKIVISLFNLVLLSVFSSCANYTLQSDWKNREITVDGTSNGWNGVLVQPGKEDFRYGIVNDTDNLYLCLSVSNGELKRRVMMQGLVLYFETSGPDAHSFSIRYPIGVQEQLNNIRKRLSDIDEDLRKAVFDNRLSEMDIDTNGSRKTDRRSVKVSTDPEIKMTEDRDSLFYVLKLPLARGSNSTVYLGCKPGDMVRMRLEIPEVAMDPSVRRTNKNTSDGESGGDMPGNRSGNMSGGGHNKMRQKSGSSGDMMDGVQIGIDLQLAVLSTNR